MPYFTNELETVGDNTLVGVLQNFGIKLQDDLRASLQEQVSGFTSKQLEQSIVFDITSNGTNYRFRLFMEYYGDLIDQGVQGVGGQRKTDSLYGKKGEYFKNAAPNSRYKYRDKKPPIKALEQWSNVNGLNPYAVRESVYRKGIKPNYFYTNVVNDDLIRNLTFKLLDMGAREVEIEITNYFNGNIN